MIDLSRQIEAYAEQLDLTVPQAAELLEQRRRRVVPTRAGRPRWWTIAGAVAGAAAVVLVAVGIVAVSRGDEAVTDSVAPTGTSVASTTTTVQTVLRFELATDTPAFDSGEPEAWDWPHVSPGAVIYRDGVYHMLRNGFGDEKPTGVGYGDSDTGVLWSAVGADPVFTFDGGQVHTGLVIDDGTWVVYFDSMSGKDEEGSHRSIGRASAPAPEGPWTVDSGPVLEPGEAGAWDETAVFQPAAVGGPDGYVMFYAGAGGAVSSIGRATSPDGITWTKDPAPVLVPNEEWEGEELTRPDVVATPDGLVMMYANRSGSKRGIATSRDGITWTRFAGNPVLTTTAVPRAAMRTGELVFHDGTYLLYLENGGSFSGTNIAVLTRDETIAVP